MDGVKVGNPFEFSRFEDSRGQQVYIPDTYCQFENGHNYFLAGSRGSGKTALLKWLSSRERLTPGGPFETPAEVFRQQRVLGLYARAVDYEFPKFSGLYRYGDTPDDRLRRELVHGMFRNYLSVLQCRLLLDALLNAAILGAVPFSAANELDAIHRLAVDPEMAGIWEPLGLERPPTSLSAMSRAFLSYLSSVHRASATARSIEDVESCLVDSRSSTHDVLADILIQVQPELASWKFVLCVDEAEALNDWQQLCLNTFVRKRRAPWTYIVAFVEGVYDTRDTMIHGQFIGSDDAVLVRLASNDFDSLATGVIELRLKAIAGERASLESLLGVYGTNEQLAFRLSRTENRIGRELLEAAAQRRDAIGANGGTTPPIFEEWLIQHDPKLADYWSLNPRDRRMVSSGRVRKKHLAAYHAILRTLDLKPDYYGLDCVIGLADNCIRDLLRMLYYCWEYMPPKAFERWKEHGVEPLFSPSVQARATMRASKEKSSELVRESVVPRTLTVMVENLARIQAKSIRSDEFGLREDVGGFLVRKEIVPAASDLMSVIDEGVYCGVLFKEVKGAWLHVRLHNMLAPLFSLPYRKPQKPITLSSREISQLLGAGGAVERDDDMQLVMLREDVEV